MKTTQVEYTENDLFLVLRYRLKHPKLTIKQVADRLGLSEKKVLAIVQVLYHEGKL